MEKLKYTITCFFCCLLLQANAADSTVNVKLVQTIQGSFADFSVDNLGNLYLLTTTNQIKKINEKFDSVGLFNDVKRYGNIYSIDASNPLKILVYYKDFLTIAVLDRFLNIRNTIDLRKQNIVQARAITQSYDNNIWVFDELDAKIKKLDETGKVLQESADFRLLFDEVPNPIKLIDADGLLYLYNAKHGFTVFDYYGAMKSNYSLVDWKDVQVQNDFVCGRDSLFLYKAKPQNLFLEKFKLNIDISHAIKVINQATLLYVLTKDGLQIFKQ